MILSIILSGIVSLLVFFFERYWTAHHPINPAPAKEAFLAEIRKPKHFIWGTKREQYASKLFDKFQANYQAKYGIQEVSDGPVLTEDKAKAMVSELTEGLTLSEREASA